MSQITIDSLLEKYLYKDDIADSRKRLLFIVSNTELCLHIISVGFNAICLENDVDFITFSNYLENCRFKGSNRDKIVYVSCCEKKAHNNRIKKYMENDLSLKLHEGWQLFKNKEFLKDFKFSDELKKILCSLVERYFPDESEIVLDRFHHLKDGKSGEGAAVGVFDFEIREHLLKNNDIFICGCPYIYQHGVYLADYGGTKLKALIEECLYPKFRKSNYINRVFNLILNTDSIQRSFDEVNQYPPTYINFQDTMLDAATMAEMPHNPQFYAVNQIPFRWSDVKNASGGTEVEKFLNFILTADDDREMLFQYVGLCLTKDTRQQRFLTLCGLGGTGKSVLIRLIESAVGNDNISNVSLQELSKRFSTSLLVGKLLNSCADLSAEMLEDSSTMKKLLGEDRLFTERKGENGFMFRNYAKLLFSANSLPIIAAERTNGFFRRLIIIEMNKIPSKVDTQLFAKLSAELPYFIRLSVDALHQMYESGGSLTTSKNSKEAVNRMWKDSDVVQAWVDDCCTIISNGTLGRGEAFESFERYCVREDRQALTKNGFYKALRIKNFTEAKMHGYMVFKGITLGKTSPQTLPETSPNDFILVPEYEIVDSPFI